MPGNDNQKTETRLVLHSQLAELSRVWPWVDALAAEYAIQEETRFAINLCLEEALSNIIRHGYRGQPNQAITVDFISAETGLTFTIEDNAPHFMLPEPTEQLDSQQPAMPNSIQEFKPWGHGIHLMRRFAGSLAWEPLPNGNRLTIRFIITQLFEK